MLPEASHLDEEDGTGRVPLGVHGHDLQRFPVLNEQSDDFIGLKPKAWASLNVDVDLASVPEIQDQLARFCDPKRLRAQKKPQLGSAGGALPQEHRTLGTPSNGDRGVDGERAFGPSFTRKAAPGTTQKLEPPENENGRDDDERHDGQQDTQLNHESQRYPKKTGI